MSNDLKVRILDVKSITDYTVREEETIEAQRYAKLEQLLQKTYNMCEEQVSKDPLEVGSYVAVYVNPFDKRLPRLWLRAIIKNIFQSVGGFLFSVYLCDYGFEKCCDKLSICQLKPHLGKAFVNFQAFHFHLSGIQSEKGIKSREVLKYIKRIFNDNKVVFTRIESKDKSGSVSGSISLNNGLDFASFLVERQLAIDITEDKLKSNCIKLEENSINNYSNSDNNNMNSDSCIDVSPVRKPLSSPFIRSANNSFVINPKHIPKSPPKEPNNESLVMTRKESLNVTNHELIDLCQNESPKATDIASTSNGISINDVNGFRRKKLNELMKQIKEKKRLEEDKSVSEMIVNGNNGYYNMDIEEETNEVEIEDEIEWPVIKSNGFVKLKPAGCQPPSQFFDKFFTLQRD